ncbi:MAG: stage V sporulation protein AD, partial [Clostridiales bacterium]|nr:stage V sporulation protein AD [Clostridiales bacterium]
MDIKRLSRQTCRLTDPPGVVSWASVAGRLERQGPLGGSIDITDDDSFFGKKTWEQGEAEMQALALRRALRKGGLTPQDVDCIFAGDLLNQNIGATFSLRDFDIPFYGVYGACSTMGESLSLAAMAVAGGFARIAAAQTSSHFCTAERQYRAPVPYGSQRAPTAQWTATAAGCCVVGAQSAGPYITHTTRGRIVDLGVTDTANMGAAMAPAAYDTLTAHFRDLDRTPQDYDLIVTGDLGKIGRQIVLDFFQRDGVKLENYDDCGCLIFDLPGQDVHAGGSGCGCSAAVLCG